MCKVYNTIGCLTTIKSHLREHNINDYKSLSQLIDFQKDYSVKRQQIISNHKLLIKQEKNTLNSKIIQLNDSIKAEKAAVEQQLRSELDKLKHQLDNLPSIHSNFIQTIFNYIKKNSLKRKIKNNKSTFDFKIANSLKHLTTDYNEKNGRYQYIVSSFDDAVMESCLPQLQELDRRKRIIDQLNNSICGALGEQQVVRELKKLSDDYILINDFDCRFNPPIYNRRENYYVNSVQIDHILVSPSGIFLIETKNWSKDSINNLNLYSPVQQIKRANFALYKILNGEISTRRLPIYKHHWGDRKISIKNLIVLISHKPREEFQYVKVLVLNDLLNYISYFEPSVSRNEMQVIANYLLNFIRE